MAGDTTRRGYGTAHQRIRAYWKPIVATGTVHCWRCGELIGADDGWHLGHDDARRTRGPEHDRSCNLRAAADKTNAARRAGTAHPLTSEDW